MAENFSELQNKLLVNWGKQWKQVVLHPQNVCTAVFRMCKIFKIKKEKLLKTAKNIQSWIMQTGIEPEMQAIRQFLQSETQVGPSALAGTGQSFDVACDAVKEKVNTNGCGGC